MRIMWRAAGVESALAPPTEAMDPTDRVCATAACANRHVEMATPLIGLPLQPTGRAKARQCDVGQQATCTVALLGPPARAALARRKTFSVLRAGARSSRSR